MEQTRMTICRKCGNLFKPDSSEDLCEACKSPEDEQPDFSIFDPTLIDGSEEEDFDEDPDYDMDEYEEDDEDPFEEELEYDPDVYEDE